MKNIATLVRNLPADKYQELAGAVNDVFENKRFNRAQRRRLAQQEINKYTGPIVTGKQIGRAHV